MEVAGEVVGTVGELSGRAADVDGRVVEVVGAGTGVEVVGECGRPGAGWVVRDGLAPLDRDDPREATGAPPPQAESANPIPTTVAMSRAAFIVRLLTGAGPARCRTLGPSQMVFGSCHPEECAFEAEHGRADPVSGTFGPGGPTPGATGCNCDLPAKTPLPVPVGWDRGLRVGDHGIPRTHLRNIWSRKARSLGLAFAVAIAVMAVVTLDVTSNGLEQSATAIISVGKADFTVAQKGASNLLWSAPSTTAS